MTDGGNLARFWENCGRRVFERHGMVWAHYRGPFYSTLPFQQKVELSPGEIREVLVKERIAGLRFISGSSPGRKAGIYICEPALYGWGSVARKQKKHVQNGLERCVIRPMDCDELAALGMELNLDTLTRQSRQDPRFLDPREWRRFVAAVSRTPGMAVTGSFAGGERLSAYMIHCRDGEWLHLMYKMSRTADLEYSPNHALDFTVLMEAAKDPGIRWVNNGFTSVEGGEGLDRYKRQLGYSTWEHNLCIHFHPLLRPFLATRAALNVCGWARKAQPDEKRWKYAMQIIEGAILSRPPEAASASPDPACQQELTPAASRLTRPGFLFPLLRLKQTLAAGGAGYMARRGREYLRRKLPGKKPSPVAKRPVAPGETLGLQPGEWVEVKSMEEIRATLDSRGRMRGLLFTAEMAHFAGRRFRVHKRVENIFLEESKQHRKIRNTVLLEHAYCQGETFGCDRSCFLFWKEFWLKRVDGPAEDQDGRSESAAIGAPPGASAAP